MENLKNKFDNAESIGVIGSPSSTGELTLDILGTAVNKGLVGKISIFNYLQDSKDHFALGQITEVIMQNIWTQDPTMRGIIRQRGRVDPITEKQDIHMAKMRISSVLAIDDNEIEPSIFGTVPSTGTSIKLLDDTLMDILFEKFKDQLFYLGKSYGTDIKMPMWFKHFGTGKTGAGEAYHIGIFGKTGSGKSVLAKMMMLGYAKHPEMSIFILDPQGEFTRDIRNNDEIRSIIEKRYNRKIELYDLHNLVLSNWLLFKKILANSEFFSRLGVIHITNKMQAATEVQKALKSKKQVSSKITTFAGVSEKKSITLPKTHEKSSFNKVWEFLGQDNVQKMIYTSRDIRQRFQNNYQNAYLSEYYEIWKKIANLFKYEGKKNAINIYDLVEKIGGDSKNIIIIDLSETETPKDVLWNDSIKLIVIGEFINLITREAEKRFRDNEVLNSLIIIDEAHRLAPRERTDNEDLESVKAKLIDGIRTTRKYGLGWMFISQTLSSLDRRIIEQLRIYIFGYGLGWGVERQALREIIGGAEDAIRLYQMFRDPQSGIGTRKYPFMTIGPISPLSFSGTPLFFNALDYPDEFTKVNFKI
ncbi:hypothetical protein LCGC14_1101710 [marine sediment metagenome]|uniref:AAA+ ATPase domain-containing protein n=1 Tax=marine sediment metagenome TaxID=412755 RepID=A0A0F9MDT6_9ZZZZ